MKHACNPSPTCYCRKKFNLQHLARIQVGVISKREPLEKIIYKITMEEKGSNMLQEKFTSFKLIAVVGVTVDSSA
jgi:hypothetical protein